jgi:hypothetical protein
MVALLVVVVLLLSLGATPLTPSRTLAVRRDPSGTGGRYSSANAAAWVDYNGDLHLGSLAAGTQRIVTRAGASPTTPLVALDGMVFWVRPTMHYSPATGFAPPIVDELDIASGTVRHLTEGKSIFASSDGRSLFVLQSDSNLVEMPVGRAGPTRTYSIPFGWYLNAGGSISNPIAVANGILVQSMQGQTGVTPSTAAIWNPSTGSIRRLGTDQGLIGAFTPRDARYSLLAWVPGNCESDPRCSLLVTNTQTGRSVQIHSPLPYGFDVGGAFSPDGTRLAVFLKSNSGLYNPRTQLAIADTRTGTLQLVPGAAGEIGESVGWARWLPGTNELMAGTFSVNYERDNHYVVNARTLSARLLDFIDNRNLDIDFSAVVVASH